MGESRNIHLGDPDPAWGLARDQEDVPWITCHGIPVLDFNAAGRRAVESDKHREALEELIDKIDWAYNDACFTAPEDTERMNRQWVVMRQAVTDAREALDPSTPELDDDKEAG